MYRPKTWSSIPFLVALFVFVLLSKLSSAQTRFWVADVPADWTSDNWANSSNGLPDGGGPPSASQHARFDINGSGNCTLNVSSDTITDITITNYPGTIEINGNTLRITGQSTFNGGNINDQTGSGLIEVASSASTNFNGTSFSVRLDVTSDNIEFDGSVFNNPCLFEKTGTNNNFGAGGNVFNDSLVVLHSGNDGYLLFGGSLPDTFNNYFSFSLSNGGLGYIAHAGSGSYLAEGVELESYGGSQGFLIGQGNGDLEMPAGSTISLGANGFSGGNLRLRNVTQAAGSAGIDLSLTGSGEIEFFDCLWRGNVTTSSPRFRTQGTFIDGTVNITKTGDFNDNSAGGNHFTGNTSITNTGEGYLLLGNGSPDTFDLDLTLTNAGQDNMYLGYSSQGTYIGGDFVGINNATGPSNTYFYIADLINSSVEIAGNAVLENIGSSSDCRFYIANRGSVSIGGDLDLTHNATGTNGFVFMANTDESSFSASGVTHLTSSSAGTTHRLYIGNQGDVTFSDSLYITNAASASNSEIYVSTNVTSFGSFDGPIILENTHDDADGIYFGISGGNSSLNAGNTISIGPAGFMSGDLTLRNFEQIGATSQVLELTSNADLLIFDAAFGGAVNFSAPSIVTRGTQYAQDVDLTKTGSNNDLCPGGNVIAGITTLTNTGTGYWLWGNGEPDSFLNNLTVYDSSSFNFYLAHNSENNYLDGDLSIFKRCFDPSANTFTYLVNNSAASMQITGDLLVDMASSSLNDRLYLNDNGILIIDGDVTVNMNSSINTFVLLSSAVTSSMTIGGNVDINSNDSGVVKTCYIGNNGDVSIAGRLDIDNNNAVDNAQVLVANGTASLVTVGGVCYAENSGDGTTRRFYLGNNGSMIFQDSLIIINSSPAANSQFYLNRSNSSHNQYNGHILLESTSPLSDGVYFGSSTGSGTLAASHTISISPNGFQAQNLFIRNFTQVGPTPQTLITTDTTTLQSFNSNWGGDVVFSAPRLYTFGSRYLGTADLTKTASGNDASQGQNYFAGNTSLALSGSGYLLFGNGNPDTFMLDLDITQNGSGSFYLAYSGGVNYVGGNINCDINTTGNSNLTYFSVISGTDLEVEGDFHVNNTSSSNSNQVLIGQSGTAQISGDLTIINNSTTSSLSRVFLANNNGSTLTVDGKLRVESNSTGNNSNIFIANSGNITVGDSLIILNNSPATSNQIFVNRISTSTGVFNGHILLESTDPDSDGITFGESGGSGTLAAGRTVSIGPNGFVSGLLYFFNFTQIGPTPQSLIATGPTHMFIQNSNWGGDVDFSAGRMRTTNSVYNGTAILEKTGANDDGSTGGNFFHQNTTLNNPSGFAFRMATSDPDTFMQDVVLNNTGTGNMQFAFNSNGNYVAGDLSLNHATSGLGNSNSSLSNGGVSSLTIDGNLDVTSNSSTTSSSVFIGNAGDMVIGGDLTVDHNANANSSIVYIADDIASDVEISGITRVTNDGSGTTAMVFFGDRGDVTCADSVYLLNASDANTSEYLVAFEDSSQVLFHGDVVIESSVPGCDGVRIGASGGITELADLQRIIIGPNGFIDGNLHIYNLHQIGLTEQSLTTTGSTYNYSEGNTWEADLTLIGPRNITRDCQYLNKLYFEKTGSINDPSFGGNIIHDTATIINSGNAYLLWGNNAADSFMTDVLLHNIGGDGIYLAHNQSGHYIGGNLTATNTANASSTYIFIAANSSSEITIDGDLSLTNDASGTTANCVVANSGAVTVNGRFDAFNPSNTPNAYVQMAINTSSSLTVQGVARFDNTATGINGFYNVGGNGTTVFNDSLLLLNSASAGNSRINCNTSSNATASYNGPIIMESDVADCDGIYFGAGGGSATLASGMPILVGPNGFNSGNLYFREFTQLGPTPINVELSGNVQLDFFNTTWNGGLNFESSRIYIRSSTFNDTCRFEKTGSDNDLSVGDNIFNADLRLVNSGAGYFMLPNNTPDDYNGNVTYVKNASGLMYPTFNATSTYAGDINLLSSTEITFGAANGRVVFDGNGPQSINDLGNTPAPNIRRFTIDKPADTLTLNMPIEVQTEGVFTSGVVSTDSINLIVFRDNSSNVGASDASFVNGYVEKIGNDAFEFPVGDSIYRPISISAPGATSARFRASYIYQNPAPTYAFGSKVPTIDHVSSREYWVLDRTAGTNNVNVTLSWDVNSGGVDNLADLLVARWDGSQWTDGGNGGTTGTTVSGTVISSVSFSTFSPFTLGSSTTSNPLPIELLSFTAVPRDEGVILEWSTASEVNNDYFTLERSADGVDFMAINQIRGAGNSNKILSYTDIDPNPYNGISYYRLRQTDFDGTTSLSKTETVYIADSAVELGDIYPLNNSIYIIHPVTSTEDILVRIYDYAGKLIQVNETALHPNNSIIKIDVPAHISSGIYVVSALSRSHAQSKKLFLQ